MFLILRRIPNQGCALPCDSACPAPAIATSWTGSDSYQFSVPAACRTSDICMLMMPYVRLRQPQSLFPTVACNRATTGETWFVCSRVEAMVFVSLRPEPASATRYTAVMHATSACRPLAASAPSACRQCRSLSPQSEHRARPGLCSTGGSGCSSRWQRSYFLVAASGSTRVRRWQWQNAALQPT
jgi:hypothetical protein